MKDFYLWHNSIGLTCKHLVISLVVSASCYAQVVPAATGPGGLPLNGELHYAFRYSQAAQFGSSLGDWQTSSPSVSLSYENENQRHPFSLNYGGGYTWTLTGPKYSTGLFQHLQLSQSIAWRKWTVMFSDDVSDRPQAPVSGFSGIPGIGEPIGTSGPIAPSDQAILTVNNRAVENIASGEIDHDLNYWTSARAGGGSAILRYPDGIGLDTNTQMANAGVTWRLNARNSISADYRFSQFSYSKYGFSFTSNSGLLGFRRTWSKKVTSDVAAGPQWTGSSGNAIVPSSLGVGINAAINYQFRFVDAGLSYSRGINGGSGYLFGSESDNMNANLSRQIGRDFQLGIEGSYRRTAGLQNNGVTSGKSGGVQANRRIGRYLSVFANYSAMQQSSSSLLPANALSHLMHVVGFGIEYSPRESHLKP
jgi:hypothetical protein